MRTLSVREARQAISHPSLLFSNGQEVIVTKHGQPLLRITPAQPPIKAKSLLALRQKMPVQPRSQSSATLIRADREAR